MKAGDSRQAQLAAHTRVAVGAILLVSPFWFTFVFASHTRSAIFNTPPPFWFGSAALSNLDAALRTQMRAELAQLHQRLQATIVYVTHDQVEAMALGSRIAIFNAGRIEQVGTPMDLYERPRNRFVAGFLGSPRMNFMPAGVVRLLAPRLPAGTVLLGVRPEHLRCVAQGLGFSGLGCADPYRTHGRRGAAALRRGGRGGAGDREDCARTARPAAARPDLAVAGRPRPRAVL